MFSKLLKHEWKANSGLLGILSLCALGAGLLGGFVLKGITYMEGQLKRQELAAFAVSGLTSALIFICVALVAYAFAVQFMNLYRFYKNKFTDEGYLTFTLPVSAEQIFLSSFLNILAWTVISALVLVLAVGMIFLVGVFDEMQEYFREMGQLIGSLSGIEDTLNGQPGYRLYTVLTVISILVAPVYSIVVLMTSITMGSVVAKKHKILATIGMFYCINFAVSTVESVLTVVPTILVATSFSENPFAYINVAMTVPLLLQIGLGIGGYFLSTHLMKHKLNLP